MWAIPFWAYLVVVVISFAAIAGLLGLVYSMAKPAEDPNKRQLAAAGRGPTGKEKRLEKRQEKAKKEKASDDEAEKEEDEEEEEEEEAPARQRRGGLARMQARRRGKPAAAVEASNDDDDEEHDVPHVGVAPGVEIDLDEDDDEDDVDATGQDVRRKKIGAKKLAKLQRKEEARQIRQAEEERRAQRKAREEQEEVERQRRKEEEKEQERLEREHEERRKQEREARELEEFNKWKGSIEVEAEGSAKAELEEKKAKLVYFADHVKREKVVLLEDLAITFGLQTQEVIDELKKVEDEGKLTGVIDERGKYIYISPEEMDAVAKFIKYRGRVSLREIATESNKLIKMQPEQTATDAAGLGEEGQAETSGESIPAQ